jgi:hypothetical protein
MAQLIVPRSGHLWITPRATRQQPSGQIKRLVLDRRCLKKGRIGTSGGRSRKFRVHTNGQAQLKDLERKSFSEYGGVVVLQGHR